MTAREFLSALLVIEADTRRTRNGSPARLISSCVGMKNITESLQLSDLDLPIFAPGVIHLNLGRVAAEGVFRPTIVPLALREEFSRITGSPAEAFPLSTRVFEFGRRPGDQVIAEATENGMPLVVRRGADVIVNFDIRAAKAVRFPDSKRPIYTYIPGFNIQKIPDTIRRPISNFLLSLHSPRNRDVVGEYGRLPLGGFEAAALLLRMALTGPQASPAGMFEWPLGKRAVFVSLHDVDTGGFLRRKERDTLFRVEEKHGIKATWFSPTAILKTGKAVEFLLQAGHEVGWHGHSHDHRLPFSPFADERVQILKNSFLARGEGFPLGMRTPRLLKSNHLFEVLERDCPALCYDTSFLQGIVPYYLWVNGRQSRILEIPTTVPTDIKLYNEVHGLPRMRRAQAILDAQIARTRKLIDVGALISIVTHPEKTLTERPELLEVYDRYLSFIRSRSDIWFATAGELYRYWTRARSPGVPGSCGSEIAN